MADKICNVCGETSEDTFELCWNCSSPLGLSKDEAERFQAIRKSTKIHCIRCQSAMRYAGLKKFHEGAKAWGYWLGDLGELFINREFYDVYVCPSCGKVEFFLDGIGDEKRPDEKEI